MKPNKRSSIETANQANKILRRTDVVFFPLSLSLMSFQSIDDDLNNWLKFQPFPILPVLKSIPSGQLELME